MKATYNKVVSEFELFCTKHLQINTFYSGQTWNFQAETNIYPAIILLPRPSTIQRGAIELKFNIIVTDLINKDRTNINEIYSDTLSIMTDVIAYFKDDTDTEERGFTMNDENVTCEPFEESFDDLVAGWISEITLMIPYDGTSCGLPITE